ncbi:MAG TPA: 4'-phosphopantetheinyl transferase superfamily protein [Polyangiaceae bacterium]|nr:4'-phosphopantetheinyl transferase superfamily protein [Polyangiaceae bacterium]
MFDDALPADFAVEWGDPREPGLPLFAEESELVVSAVEKRRLEFSRGRQCARAALRRLGISDRPLLTGSKREPLWPAGVVGSITHTNELCLAAVAWQANYAGVGIDVEPAKPLELAVAKRIATEAEMNALGSMPPLLAARLIFSAKEAFYKCQFYRTREFLGFSDVSIELEPQGDFFAQLLIDAGPLVRGDGFRGRWRQQGGFLFTAIHMPADARDARAS